MLFCLRYYLGHKRIVAIRRDLVIDCSLNLTNGSLHAGLVLPVELNFRDMPIKRFKRPLRICKVPLEIVQARDHAHAVFSLQRILTSWPCKPLVSLPSSAVAGTSTYLLALTRHLVPPPILDPFTDMV